MESLQGHVALVTGASQGIGRACALTLAKAGATVALAARNEEKLKEVVAQIEAEGGKAVAFRLDVASEDAIKSTVKRSPPNFGKIDILVNNAGITRDNLLMRMKRADWDDVLTTNLSAPFLLTQAVHRRHVEAALGTNHQHHLDCRRNGRAWTSELRLFQSRTHRPHAFRGARSRFPQHHGQCRRSRLHRHSNDRGAYRRTEDRRSRRRFRSDVRARMSDVANAVLFLASNEAGYITGHVLM